MALTDKQERFCNEYMKDLNATQAAIRAGYSVDTARFTASENLTKHNIQERIAELKKIVSDRNDITVDKVVNKLWKFVEYEENDRTQAANLLLKHLGGFEKDNEQSKDKVVINLKDWK